MPKSILVIDDDLAVAQKVCALLAIQGYVASHANSVDEGFSHLIRSPFQLVLVDLSLCETSSKHLRCLIEKSKILYGIRIVYMTDRVPAPESSNAQFIVKPFNKTELEQTLEQAFALPLPWY